MESNTTQKYSRSITIRNVTMKQFVNNYYLRHYADNLHSIEPETLDWIDSFDKNSVFYDVGASGGIFSLYAAIKRNCHIIAFEPEAQNFAILEKNHYLNQSLFCNPFMTFNLALGDHKEISKLFIFRYEAGAAMKILDKPIKRLEETPFKPAHVQYVIQERLDDFVSNYNLPCPNYIKIDVDGSEKKIIEGSQNLLRNKNIRSILVEIEEKNNYLRTLEDIKKLGFIIKEKYQVENYKQLFNYLLVR